MNSPYKFTDPLGLMSVNSVACGTTCSKSGPIAGGSDITGNDGSFSWATFYFGQQKQKKGVGSRDASISEGSPAEGTPLVPPQINVRNVSLVSREAKRTPGGKVIKEGESPSIQDTTLATGIVNDKGEYDLNLNNASDSLSIGGEIFIKVELDAFETGDKNRAEFKDDATVSVGLPNIVNQGSVNDTTISADGSAMTLYVPVTVLGRDGMRKGKLSTITIRANASYVDEYDSSTNKFIQTKSITRDIRISLTNIRPVTNPFLKSKEPKKPF